MAWRISKICKFLSLKRALVHRFLRSIRSNLLWIRTLLDIFMVYLRSYIIWTSGFDGQLFCCSNNEAEIAAFYEGIAIFFTLIFERFVNQSLEVFTLLLVYLFNLHLSQLKTRTDLFYDFYLLPIDFMGIVLL